jgi:hypothetical protein
MRDQGVHGRDLGGVDQRAALPALADQAGMAQLGEMEGERGRRDAAGPGDGARRHAGRARAHQPAKDFKADRLRQGRQCPDNGYRFHSSITIELRAGGK